MPKRLSSNGNAAFVTKQNRTDRPPSGFGYGPVIDVPTSRLEHQSQSRQFIIRPGQGATARVGYVCVFPLVLADAVGRSEEPSCFFDTSATSCFPKFNFF
jgi:hypothetical protein